VLDIFVNGHAVRLRPLAGDGDEGEGLDLMPQCHFFCSAEDWTWTASFWFAPVFKVAVLGYEDGLSSPRGERSSPVHVAHVVNSRPVAALLPFTIFVLEITPMASIDSLETLLVNELRDLYDAEKRLTKAIPKMMKAATNEELRQALSRHLAETEEQVARLENAFEQLDQTAKAKPCAGMRGIIEEGDEHMNEDYEDDGLRDAAIIGAAQRVEHYEIAAYGTAAAYARLLGHDEVVRLLEQTLEEEKNADQTLTEVAESVVNLDASEADDEESEMESKSSRERSRSSRAASPRAASSRSSRSSR
jgi:ferritin-like metal-binding protein YciE